MPLAERSRRTRWSNAFFALATLGALAAIGFACLPAQLPPQPGVVELTEPARVAVPGGHVNAAGGSYIHEGAALSLDTRLGELSLGARYSSGWGWMFGSDVRIEQGYLRDATGARIALSALANGAAAPGTHWVKLDASRVKTKGGLVHELDPASGRLIAMYWSSAAYPRLVFVQMQIGAALRTTRVEQCTSASASACTLIFALGYDAAGRLERIDDRAGRSALFGYDATGRLAFSRDGLDVAKGWPGERYEYAGSFLSAIVSSEGERIEIASDASGRATQVRAVGAGDPTWRFAYGTANASGISSIIATDPLGHATSFAIDTLSRVQSITNALGERTSFTWSGQRPASRELPDGSRTTWVIEGDDVASETLPSGNVRAFTYAPAGVNRERPHERPLAELRDALGLVERRSYDARGRLVEIENGAGERTQLAYAADESIALVTQPSGAITRLDRVGEHGHPERVSADGVNWASIAYDAVGNVTRVPRAAPLSGGVARVGWDEDRNLSRIEVRDLPPPPAQPTLELVALHYRSDRQLARVTRPYGGETRFVRDALGRLVELRERSSPGAAPTDAWSATRYALDPLGRATASELANGMRREAAYDAVGRLIGLRELRSGVLENEVAISYERGRVVRARAPAGGFDESYAYDAAGRPSTVVHTLGESSTLGYDARGRLVSLAFTLPNGAPLATLTRGYDAADREISLAALGTTLARRVYEGGSQTLSAYANGIDESTQRIAPLWIESGREYYRRGVRLATCAFEIAGDVDPVLRAEECSVVQAGPARGSKWQRYEFSPDAAPLGPDRRLALATGSSTYPERFAYDHLSSLVRVDSAAFSPLGDVPTTRTIALNAEHNRVLATTSTDLLVETWTHASDDAGFERARTRSGLGSTPLTLSFAWTAAGRIASIAANGSVEAELGYDALGRRRSLRANGVTTRWRFGGLVEANASDTPVAIDLGELRIALDGQHRFRHADARGNFHLRSSMAGQIERSVRFGAYGDVVALGANDASGFARGTHLATSAGPFIWVGERVLDPRSGRFLSPDPLWNPLNGFAYTAGNPVDFWDAGGLHPGHNGGLADHKAIELATITRSALFLLASNAVVLANLAPTPGTLAAAAAATISALAADATLDTLEKFHELEFDANLPPELGAPPTLQDPLAGLEPFADCVGLGCFGNPRVQICDEVDNCS